MGSPRRISTRLDALDSSDGHELAIQPGGGVSSS
jgi:hypothetical protein